MSESIPGTAPAVTDEAIVKYLKENDPHYLKLVKKVEDAANQLGFLKDDSWIERAINGLDKPNLDERMKSQDRTYVLKDLRNKAAKRAEAGAPYVAPTEEEINSAIERRKADRQQAIEDKMNQKIADARAALVRQSVQS